MWIHGNGRAPRCTALLYAPCQFLFQNGLANQVDGEYQGFAVLWLDHHTIDDGFDHAAPVALECPSPRLAA